MIDKQIIIDGVDVSQCEYYSIKHNSCNRTISGSCIKENCQTFRLLQIIKRKEQECEELKEELYYWVNGEYCDNECNVVKELDQLKAENDELKKTVMLKCPQCDEVYLNLVGTKLYETLTEIKEIAENVIKNVSDRCIEITPMYGVHKQILQKISEAENEITAG